ncbi:hypothetical protein, partial [Caballeronia sp. LZ043]|uniref:hypothetical protein n=1 Tax=Caballeronia sp. LZ043 TaxID=3038569 RepID=UPI0028551EAD
VYTWCGTLNIYAFLSLGRVYTRPAGRRNFRGSSIPDGLPMSTQTWLFFFIFILKAFWSGGIAAFVYILIGELHFEAYIRWNLLIFPYISAFLFALALLGIFGSSRFVWLRNLNSFWCYAAIVWGFFLLAMIEQLVEPLKRRTERATA